MGAALRSAGFEQVDASALDRLSRDFDAFFTTICAYSVLQARTRRAQIHDVVSTFDSLGDAFSMQALRDFAHGPTLSPKVGEMTPAANEQRGETTRHERNLQHFAPCAAAREAEREQRTQQAGTTPAWAMLGSGFLGSSERRESELEALNVSSSEDGASDEEADARSRSGKRRRFAHQVPARATCQRDKIVPTSADDNPEHVFGVPARLADDVQCEEIPAWLPAFPDGHTWKRTPVFPQSTSTSLRPLELVELKLEHSRLTQEALARLIRSTDAASSGSKFRAGAVSKSRSDAYSWAPFAKSNEVAPASQPKAEEHYGTRSRTRTNTQPAAQGAAGVQADSPLSSPPPSQLTSGDNALASSDAASLSTPNEPRKRAKLALRLRVGSNRSSNASEVFDGTSFPASHGSMGPPMSSSPAPIGASSTMATDERYINPPIPQSAMVPSSMLTPMFESNPRTNGGTPDAVVEEDPLPQAVHYRSQKVTRTARK
ncbi:TRANSCRIPTION INITIATION FACTOR TFIID SUBUNIT 8 [Ceraceosorus bombacis]|uniref:TRANSCRIPTION INITIATION FACTOR TFIID SUBUNIT 8 n=1 Tax=Ceraceosorus bombacis TaxID=401625 RepID=A0A0P1BD12_9BASI|nr:TRANSCRIPTION INITIATION FACTOR TFIID SUBUNIT 8 [Ceraceosorus bombacis]